MYIIVENFKIIMIFDLTIITIILFLDFISSLFLKSLVEDPNYSGLTIKRTLAISKFPPLGAIIVILLVSFGLLLITIETINKLINN